jgi:hypothetical protein
LSSFGSFSLSTTSYSPSERWILGANDKKSCCQGRKADSGKEARSFDDLRPILNFTPGGEL